MKRREFIRSISAVTAVSLLSGADFPQEDPTKSAFYFSQPFDGGIIHERCSDPVLGTGKDANGKKTLRIQVSGVAPIDSVVEIKDPRGKIIPAKRQGKEFKAEVELTDRFSTIQATVTLNGKVTTIRTRPVWVQNSFKRFRFQIDDNSFFLRDIYINDYKDLFQCFYLSELRRLHQCYGAKFALNCFYSRTEQRCWPCAPQLQFNMTMMSDKYKAQWNDNADWLRLTFHSKDEFPNNPYEHATAEQIGTDFDLTREQIIRFADKAYEPAAIVHFGNIPTNTFKVFADRGVRCLVGGFIKPPVTYQLPEYLCAYIRTHSGWYDFDSKIIFSRSSGVCNNNVNLEDTYPILQKTIDNPNTSEVLNLITHEQYFWQYYKHYIPDHFQRVEASLRFAVEHGYKPGWFNEGFYGVPEK